MTTVTPGTFSVKVCSKSKTTGNYAETILTGSGEGAAGNLTFQGIVLDAIEDIIQNYYDPDYVIPDVVVDGTTTNASFLFYDPATVVTQVFNPSAEIFADFLLMTDTYTAGTTTEITDSTAINLFEYIANQTFQTLRKIALEINNTSAATDVCTSEEEGRFKYCIETCVFSMTIILQ